MDLTIVIPIYNVEEYLEECLEGIPHGVKVILVNDGSIDSSENICIKYAEINTNVRLINKVNGGLSDARNAGMQFVDTKYVFFLDSDDRIDGTKLLRALDYAIEHDLDWLQCGYAYEYPEFILRQKQNPNPRFIDKEKVLESLVTNGYIKNFAWGKIYKSSIVRKHQFPKGKFFEDSFWQYKIINDSITFGIFPDIVSFYRSRPGSISDKFSFKYLDLLEGTKQRHEFIISNYPNLVNQSSLVLWKLAYSFKEEAQHLSEETKTAYAGQYSEILQNYCKQIESGIKSERLVEHLRDQAKYRGLRPLVKLIEVILRISNYFTSSDFERELKKT